ncbi:protein BIG GRAIN 1-like E [Iris pallida]|uniref:Protein BIG GRAIN 1-like E n=1 Tax=Iris pallida TaxID=29817 RepID=A0AAX6G3S7_IRIPA|nr:protein BIG GRAIN 1-like E [Iris pallida]
MSSSSLQQTMRRRRDSNELDVFEATKYFSGEVGTPRALRDAPRLEAELLGKNAEVMEIIRYVEEEGNCKQPCSPGGKLASLLYSLFQQSATSKKNNKKTKKKSPKSSKSEVEEEKPRKNNTLYVSSSSSSEFRTPWLYSSKRKGWEEKSASDCRHEFTKQEELWSAELKLEEEREFGKEEDGAESESSSDLFELKSYDLNDISTELPVFGSTT